MTLKHRMDRKGNLKLASPRRRVGPGWQSPAAALISPNPASNGVRSFTATNGDAVPVILIEDNRLLLDGLKSVLSAQGLDVVAAAKNGAEALRHVTRLRPHLVLLDATLGDRDSIKLVTSVKKLFPEIKVIVMHLLPAQEDVVAFVRAGVSGFIMKDATLADFVSTIRAVADGESVLPPSMTGSLFSHIADQVVTGPKRLKAAMRMTSREREIAALIGRGLDNRAIGERLGIGEAAVRSHVHNILEKVALHTRLEVASATHERHESQRGKLTLRRSETETEA
jgi:DNA-binding NarL/FixJ family response regulator